MFHQTIGTGSLMKEFHPLIEDEIRKSMSKVVRDPDEMLDHFKQYVSPSNTGSTCAHSLRSLFGAIILKITFGYEVRERGDPFVARADQTMREFESVAAAGTYLVDAIPLCKINISVTLDIALADQLSSSAIHSFLVSGRWLQKSSRSKGCDTEDGGRRTFCLGQSSHGNWHSLI
jgi:hypothetical protein